MDLSIPRSAPASPSHIGISGTMTPDNLSRESSPVPEGNEVDHQPAMPQPMVPKLAQIHHDIRYSQSAPGSPSGKTHRGFQVIGGRFCHGHERFLN